MEALPVFRNTPSLEAKPPTPTAKRVNHPIPMPTRATEQYHCLTLAAGEMLVYAETKDFDIRIEGIVPVFWMNI